MYSVYVNKRPIKTAFLIDPTSADWQGQLDAVWRYNQEQWGGRFNPVIPTDGTEIAIDWWDFLKAWDPDFILAFASISPDLSNRLIDVISPIEIEILRTPEDGIWRGVFSHHTGIQALPRQSTFRTFARFLSNDYLARVESSPWTTDPATLRFLLRGIGYFENIEYMNNALATVEKQKYFGIGDREELVAALQNISNPPPDPPNPLRRYVYPIQFSMLGKQHFPVEFESRHSNEVFGVIVGDTFDDQAFLRNKALYERDNAHTRLNHIWLPTEFANDQGFMEVFARWLSKTTQSFHLFSFSVHQSQLEQIGETLLGYGRSFNQFFLHGISTEFHLPKIMPTRTFLRRISPPSGGDIYRGHTRKDQIELINPTDSGILTGPGRWIGEVLVESKKARFYSYDQNDRPFWWLLPHKNHVIPSLIRSDSIHGFQSRTNADRIPCILFGTEKPTMTVTQLTDFEFFNHVIAEPYWQTLAGGGQIEGLTVSSISASNNGLYLNGFIEVFGSLNTAYQFLASRFWRKILERLSGKDLRRDRGRMEAVTNKLNKLVRQIGSQSMLLQRIDSLADCVVDLAKNATNEFGTLTYAEIEEEAQIEYRDFNSLHAENWEFDEDARSALNRHVSGLLESGVLQLGVKQRCPRCGIRNWHQVGHFTQSLRCIGCAFDFSLRAEPRWVYRLNSLVQQGISRHGLLPIVLILGRLLERSQSAFSFVPCMDLFGPNSDGPLTDSDIVCMSDGKLIMGEIKESPTDFNKQKTIEQVERLGEIARNVKPDLLLFGAMPEANNLNPSWPSSVTGIRDGLRELRIEVEWFQMPEEVMQPDPPR